MWKLWSMQNTDYHLAFKNDGWPKPKTEHTYFVPALAEQSLADAAFKSLKNEGGAGRIRQAYIAWDKKKSSDSALCEQPRESPSRELPTKDMFSRSDKWTFARTTTVDKWDSSLSLLDH